MKVRKQLVLIAVCCLLPALCWAQKNEVSLTAGGLETSDPGSGVCEAFPGCPPTTVFGIDTGGAFQASFAHRLADFKAVGLYFELPLIVSPSRGTSSGNLSSLFFTPSVKLNLLSGATVSPFVSIGAGLAHFSVTSTGNTAAAGQVGGGVDFRTPLRLLGIRAELRDIISGEPGFTSSGSLRNNVFMGGGIVLRF